MHIPPYHQKKTWQYFFVGVLAGGVTAYLIFIFMYGIMYEKLLEENHALHAELTDKIEQNKALLEAKEDLDERFKQPVTVENIDIKITNPEELKLDKLLVHQLVELIKKEIDDIIGKKLESISESNDLLISTIENKNYHLHDFTYSFKVTKLIISRRLTIHVQAGIEK